MGGLPVVARARSAELKAVMAELGLDPETIETARGRDRRAGASASASRARPRSGWTARTSCPRTGAAVGLTCRVYRLRDGRVSPTPDPADVREALREERCA